jgi:hypothetical protein
VLSCEIATPVALLNHFGREWRGVYHAGMGLAFHARLHALGLDPVAPVPLGPVQRIIGPPN